MGVEEVWEDIRRAKIDKWLKRGGAKPPAPKHGHGTTTFRVKNATYAKHGDSMGVIQHTQNKPPKGKVGTGKIGTVKVPSGYKPQRYAWSSKPPGPGMPGWKAPVPGSGFKSGRFVKGGIGPVIRSTARIGSGRGIPSSGPNSRLIAQMSPKWQGAQQGISRSAAIRQNMALHSAKLAKTAKIVKSANLIGLTITAAEGIYKGTKRALGPGGTEFHTKKSKNKYGTKGY